MSINVWATNGVASFALPLSAATPDDPATQEYTLAWNPVTQLIDWVPVSLTSAGAVAPVGDVQLASTKALYQGGTKVVGARRTGWTPGTGTEVRSTFDTATVTLPQLAQQFLALQADLIAHGLIGT